VTNRSMLATICLLIALITGAGSWLAQNASVISRRQTIGNERWVTAFREKKPVYSPAEKLYNGDFTHLKPSSAVQANKLHKSVPDSAVPALQARVKGNNAETNLYKQTPAQLWEYWKMLLSQSEFQQLPIIGAILAERLRKHPDPEVYQRVADLLSQPDVTVEAKAILLDLLGEIATPDSLVQLLNLAEQGGMDSPLTILALQAISRIGDNRWDGRFHEELSPALEAIWSDPEIKDQAFLSAIGKAIAAIGAQTGVDQLLLTVSGSSRGNETEEANRIKQEIAFDVIPEVRNPGAVDVLSSWFGQESLGTPAFEVSGSALAEIGSPAATQKIMDWAQKAPAEGARNLEDWLSKIDDADSLGSISAAQDLEFQNPEIKTVIDSVAANINPDTASSSTTIVGEHSRNLSQHRLRGK